MTTYRALIADDEPTIRLIYKTSLHKLPIHFDEASNGGEALELVKQNVYDFILLDLVMPEVSGFEFFKRSRAEKLSLPFVIVASSLFEKELVMKAFELGASDYLFKPIQPERLRIAIQGYLDIIAETREKFSSLKQLLGDDIDAIIRQDPTWTHSPPKNELRFDSLTKAMAHMIFNRATGTLAVDSPRGSGEIRYQNGRLQAARFEDKTGIDALDAMKMLLRIDVTLKD